MIFAVALMAVTAAKLNDQPGDPSCRLNASGQVCVFVYVSGGEILLTGLLIVCPILWLAWVHRRNPSRAEPRILGSAFPAAAFTWFWQLVLAVTIQIRGAQAADAGVPGQGARTAAWALCWCGFAFSTLTVGVLLGAEIVRWWSKRRTSRGAGAHGEDKPIFPSPSVALV